MTTLTITPDIAKKKLKLAGTVASGEKVAVTVVGFGTVATENLRLRVVAGATPVGYFPLENEDAWTVSGADLICTLDLATWQAERHCKFGAEVCFILEDTGTPQLYGVGDFSLRPWIKLSGVDVPKNLDNYKVRMDALLAEINRVEGVANGKYTKPGTGIPKTDLAPSVRTSLDKADAVTQKVSKSAFDALLGLSLPDSATQKDTRQIVQRILTVLQNAATCIALMVALPVFGIDGATAWEDVPPDRTVKSVVEQFSPPADFSTNNAQLVETIEAIAPGLAPSNVVGKVFDSSRSYVVGEVMLFSNELYRALYSNAAPSIPPINGYSYLWEKLENPALDEVMGGALHDSYLRLGAGGYNDAQEFEVRIGTASDGGVSYLHGYNGYIGVRNTKNDRAAYITPEGHIYIVRNGTPYNTYDLNMMIYGGNIRPIDIDTIKSEAPLVISPKYVYQYLTNLYYTASEVNAAIGNAGHVPNTRTVNGKPLSADIVLLPADIGTLSDADIAAAIAAHKPLRVYGDEGCTNYIDGARGVYILPPPTLCYTNTAGLVYAPAEENYWRPESGTTYLRYANFHYFYFDGTSEVVGVPVYYGITFSEDLNFYSYERPSEWQNVGTLALVSDIPSAASPEDLVAATNDLAKTVPNNITRTGTDATLVHCDDGTCTNALIYIRQASSTLAGLMTAADKNKMDNLAPVASSGDYSDLTNKPDLDAISTNLVKTVISNSLFNLTYDETLQVTWKKVADNGAFYEMCFTNINMIGVQP